MKKRVSLLLALLLCLAGVGVAETAESAVPVKRVGVLFPLNQT